MDNAAPQFKKGEFLSIFAAWLLLAVLWVCMAVPNTTVPGLFYDEAQCAGMAKDFLTGHSHQHTRGYQVINIGGRPFPAFVQPYGGAVKSWLLLPVFAVFGTSQAVLRLTAMAWGLVALLLFMLWTWRWLGRNTALLAGVLLASDPTFFFISVLDWGPVLPSFLCRFACFYFALRWWQLRNQPQIPQPKESKRKLIWFAFFAGFFAGLGFFNKIDFAVLLAGVLAAFYCCNIRRSWFHPLLTLAILGFLVTGGPMLAHLPAILGDNPSGGNRAGELAEKFNTALAMYNGSYFYRLMDAGGMFNKMFQPRALVFAPIGIAVLLAGAFLVFRPANESILRNASGDPALFLLLATLFITIGTFLLPKAVRIHHMVAVYPFPQLMIALAVTRLRHCKWVTGLFVLLVAFQLLALCKTQQLLRQTGGRGRWSDAINAFARQVNDRSDLTIVSADWGFNEQLIFLTDGPKLIEPFWSKWPADARSTNLIYLLHPPEYSLYHFGQSRLDEARREGPAAVELKPWLDHQDRVAFYSLHFRGP